MFKIANRSGKMGYRMKDRLFGVRIVGTVVFLVLTPSLAWSYIDPGNGAYMVQVLFTLAGAALFYIRHPVRFFHAVRNWVFRGRSSDSEAIDSQGDIRTSMEPASPEKAVGRTD